MKTVRFTMYDPGGEGYGCSEPGDQSGEYVKADVARGLVDVCRKLIGAIHTPAYVGSELHEAMTEARKAIETAGETP